MSASKRRNTPRSGMYRFEKFGTLWFYRGIPVYAGDKCVTHKRLAYWWPVNWLAFVIVIVALPFIEFKMAQRRKEQ